MIPIQGLDYSDVSAQGWPAPATFKAYQKWFACRYLGGDERCLVVPERISLTTNGIPIVAIKETTGKDFRFGTPAGVEIARQAEADLASVGLPPTQPFYVTVDDDTTEADLELLRQYLTGVASVIGLARVGIYGSADVLDFCFDNHLATYFWQTTAWSGGRLSVHAHLYQYEYNLWIAGTNCDATEALQPHYGQSSDFTNPPSPEGPPVATKKYAKPIPTHEESATVVRFAKRLTVIKEYQPRQHATDHAAPTAAVVKVGTTVMTAWLRAAADGSIWYETKGGSRHPRWAFFEEKKS